MSKLILVASDIRSTHNVGAFYRTCDGFGADLALCGITPRPSGDQDDDRLPHITSKMNKAINKTALGAEHSVLWTYYKSTHDAIESLKSEGYLIVAIEQAANSIPLSQLPSHEKTALVVGPEVSGLPQEMIKLCDVVCEIPMVGMKESFNVSVAAGIALYQANLINVLK